MMYKRSTAVQHSRFRKSLMAQRLVLFELHDFEDGIEDLASASFER